MPVFRYIGTRSGSPDRYVKEENNQLIPQPSVIESINQITDRCRNFVERMIQEEALGILAGNGGGTLLIDGALAVRRRATCCASRSGALGSCREAVYGRYTHRPDGFSIGAVRFRLRCGG